MTKAKVILLAAIALSALSLPVKADDQTVHAQTSKPGPPSTSASPFADSASSLPIKYIGNAESHKFHRPSCPFARIMAPNKKVGFHYRTQAIACAHVPCRYCLPPVWTVVRGRLITPARTAQPQSELPAGPLLQPDPLRRAPPETLTDVHGDPPGEIAPDPP